MKRKSSFLCMTAFAAFLLCSCATQHNGLKELRAFQHEIELNGSNYTISDWKDAASDYAKINKRIKSQSENYTQEELDEVAELNGKCLGTFTKQAASKVKGMAKSFKGLVGGFLDALND